MIDVPHTAEIVRAGPAVKAATPQPLSDLLDEDLGPTARAGPDLAGPSVKRPMPRLKLLPSDWNRGSVRQRKPAQLTGIAGFVKGHKLILATLGVSGFWILYDLGLGHLGALVLIGFIGIGIALGAWKSQWVENDPTADNWLWLEGWFGRLVWGAPMVLIVVLYLWVCVHLVIGDRGLTADIMFFETLWVVFILTVLAVAFAAAERFGFFKMSCWLFLTFTVVGPIVAALMTESMADRLRNGEWLGPAVATSPAPTDQPTPVPDRKIQPELHPQPTVPPKAAIQPGPTNDHRVSTNDTPSRPVVPWTAAIDPRREPLEPIVDSAPVIPLGQPPRYVAPAVASPFLAVGSNLLPESARELWDLRTARSTKRIQGKIDFTEPLAMSTDGTYLAGPITFNDKIEVWSFEKNELAARIPSGMTGLVSVLEFATPDRLVFNATAGGNPVLRIWDLRKGAVVQDVRTLKGFNANRGASVISPGGRYFVNVSVDQRIQVYDLATGKVVGDLPLPVDERAQRLQLQGLCISADGSQLAGLFTELRKSRILDWSFADTTLLADYEISPDIVGDDALRQPSIEWLPDRSGWLVYQRTIVPFHSGPYVWARPIAGDAARLGSPLRGARVIDDNHLLLASDQLLATFRLPRDGNGKLILGDGPTALESLLAQRFAGPRGAGPGPVRTPANATNADGLPRADDVAADREFEKKSLKYVRDTYKELIAGDEKGLEPRMQWLPGGKRPTIGLRWGLGVQITGQLDPPLVRSVGELGEVTGPVGPAVLAKLQQRAAESKFGEWPKADDPRFREVRFLGGGKLAELQDAAKRQGLDLLVLIDLNTQMVGVTKKWETSLRVRILDLAANQAPVVSQPLTSTQVALAEQAGAEDPRSVFAQRVQEKIDADYQLGPVPELTAEQVHERVATIARQKFDNPLPVLAELRYYQLKKLAAPADLDPIYDNLLGPGGGRKMLGHDEAERRQAIKAILDRP